MSVFTCPQCGQPTMRERSNAQEYLWGVVFRVVMIVVCAALGFVLCCLTWIPAVAMLAMLIIERPRYWYACDACGWRINRP